MIIDEAIACEQAAHIHRNVPTGIIGGFFVASLLVAAFWPSGNHTELLLWLAAGGLLLLWRLADWRGYRVKEFTPQLAQNWLNVAMRGAAISGGLWGLGSLVFYRPEQFVYHLLYVFAVAMMGVTAMFSFSAHRPIFLAYFLPATIPAVIGIAIQGTLLHVEIGLGLLIFMIVTLRFYANFNRVFMKTLLLGFENVALVRELTVQKEAAESANLAKSRFLAAASHDLRQPMHALTLYLGALESHDIQGPARTNLANVRQCARTMDEMFRALLDISRLDAGAVQTDLRKFALQPLLDRIRIEFEPQAKAQGLEFKVRPCARLIHSDPDLVERILRNFITNAIRYTERGRILVGCRRHGEKLRLAVYDTGSGIAPAEQRKIFEEFYQVGNPERDRTKGIGLGLAIVDRLARLLATSVTMVSKMEQGSMFAIDLPLAQGEPTAQETSFPPSAVRVDMSGLFIVVVDDEESILAATREILQQWGCKVVTASSGAAALEQLGMSAQAPDALICDFRLRNHETGIDVIDALRAEFNADIPAIIVSGDSAPARMREAEANGLRVLHKPVNDRALRKALTQILAPAPAHSEA